MLEIGFIIIVITLIGIDVQLRKANKQNEEIIDLLKQIKER
ncbi:hypothetical protein [Aquibacillus rhizosphaerae]|uniref:YrzO family protein n=1 Tax=Aquibacillus rhizosphaerae TaxID=3051431 RepID=A0ABT7L953_9BACI|nr:hypothetical protein [Aquibacillus sp. LR5S19]MDL4842398.1 hypothetical protein [Aquibacillus sp. LR5S19]